MDFFIGSLINLFIYAAPFIILYFVISAAVRKGIDSSEAGRAILEKHHERKNIKK